jgi:hypothetical protein
MEVQPAATLSSAAAADAALLAISNIHVWVNHLRHVHHCTWLTAQNGSWGYANLHHLGKLTADDDKQSRFNGLRLIGGEALLVWDRLSQWSVLSRHFLLWVSHFSFSNRGGSCGRELNNNFSI